MSKRPDQIVDDGGQAVVLGTTLGQGGEGAVWDVPARPDLVAKIYHAPLSRDRADKIQLMSRLRTEALGKLTAWPIGLLRHRVNGPIGLLMPKVADRKDIHHLYSPKSRRSDFQRADWRFLIRSAANTARAFAAVHETGSVIGDVNHGSVLVGQDATVRLIDCDSFQISVNGRRFFCEVGVETFTPPELQGRSFAGVVRTPNHDNFGLAVLVFQLLFMGRHPFAGRFAGPGDMPIARAIKEIRFPYGSRHQAAQMARPPGAPPLSIVGAEVEFLFERAFAPELIHGGRPSSLDWIQSLSKLETELKQCASNPSHWYRRDGACPWCPMEGATGVPLFGLQQMAGGQLGSFDILALWRQMDAIADPGPLPSISSPVPQPTSKARGVAQQTAMHRVTPPLAAVAATIAAFIYMPALWFLPGPIVWFLLSKMIDGQAGRAELEKETSTVIGQWRAIEDTWHKRASNRTFEEIKARLVRERRQWEGLPTERLRRLDQLKANQRKLQLDRYLDIYEIASAKIESIGPGRKQTLESYGIETALDVTLAALGGVPGFGPKTNEKLLRWRASIEARFVFDPNRGTDPRDVQQVEASILSEKRDLETKLRTGLNELRQASAQALATRQHMRDQVERAHAAFLQAEADRRAARL